MNKMLKIVIIKTMDDFLHGLGQDVLCLKHKSVWKIDCKYTFERVLSRMEAHEAEIKKNVNQRNNNETEHVKEDSCKRSKKMLLDANDEIKKMNLLNFFIIGIVKTKQKKILML